MPVHEVTENPGRFIFGMGLFWLAEPGERGEREHKSCRSFRTDHDVGTRGRPGLHRNVEVRGLRSTTARHGHRVKRELGHKLALVVPTYIFIKYFTVSLYDLQ